jgi:hypothetical protein
MLPEKDIFDVARDFWRGFNQAWLWLSGAGVLATALLFVFKEFVVGVAGKIGEWAATKILAKSKMRHIKDKAKHADSRGELHSFLAEELYKLNRRLDACDQRHQVRDLKDAELDRKLAECHKRREELEIKAVWSINEAKAAALEATRMIAENTRLRDKLGRG